jgi:hypothetical protein
LEDLVFDELRRLFRHIGICDLRAGGDVVLPLYLHLVDGYLDPSLEGSYLTSLGRELVKLALEDRECLPGVDLGGKGEIEKGSHAGGGAGEKNRGSVVPNTIPRGNQIQNAIAVKVS